MSDSAAEALIQSLSEAPAQAVEPDTLSSLMSALEAKPEPVVETPPTAAPPLQEERKPTEATITDLDPNAEDDIPDKPPGQSSEKAQLDWKGLRTRAKTSEGRMKELETALAAKEQEWAQKEQELGDFRVKSAKLLEYEAKEAAYQEAQKELAVSRVEGTEEYKRTITQPFEAIEGTLKAIADGNNANLDDLIDAVVERDPVKRREKISAAVAGLDVTDQHEILQASKDAQVLFAKRDQIRADAARAKEELESRRSEAEERAKTESKAKYAESLGSVHDNFVKKVPFVALKEGETAEGIFGLIRQQAADIDLSDAAPGMKAYSAMAGFALPRMAEQIRHLNAEKAALEARITELTAAKPGNTTPGGAPPVIEDAGDFLARMGKNLGTKI